MTRLFQAGVDRKIVKEFTGHVSDAVDKYQITSDQQKKELSEIIGGRQAKSVVKQSKLVESDLEVKVSEVGEKKLECQCVKQTLKVEESKSLGLMINELLKACKGGKATVRLEINFSD